MSTTTKLENIADYCSKAQYFFDNNLTVDCQNVLKFILQKEPENSMANELMAYLSKKEDNNEAALKYLEIACKDINCSASSLFYLGLLYKEKGDNFKALSLIKSSIDKAGEFIEGLNEIGVIYSNLRKYDDAIDYLIKATKFVKNEAYVYLNLSLAYCGKENLLDSLKYLNIATEISPNYLNIWVEKAVVLNKLNRNLEALNVINKALKLSNSARIQTIKGIILNCLDKKIDSLSCYKSAIEIEERYEEAWFQSGMVLMELEEYNSALESFNKAININDNYFEAWLNKGVCLNLQRNYKEAYDTFNFLNIIYSNNKYVLTNIGVTLTNLNRSDESITYFDKAIELDKVFAEAYANKGEALNILKKYEEAKKNFCIAFKLKNDMPSAHNNFAFTQFMLKDFEFAWKEYKWRWSMDSMKKSRFLTSKPIWDGVDKRINLLIWGEQGIGEQILFSSMLNDISQSKKLNIIVLLNKKILSIFQFSFPNIKFYDRNIDKNKLNFDEIISIGDIGIYYRNSLQKFEKVNFPYLKINNAKKVALFEDNEYTRNNKLICGISWNSVGKNFGNEKSIPLEQIIPLLEIPNIDWINLQYNVNDNDKAIISSRNIKFIKLKNSDVYDDVENLARCIQHCDLIVTCSNSTAHIAGALNKKTLLILPYLRGRLFYWDTIKNKSLWYPSIEIFNQETLHNWYQPIQNIQAKLTEIVNLKSNFI
jgi:tetratricopeptide (TPR) repeat protein